jgi:hypothetical protein
MKAIIDHFEGDIAVLVPQGGGASFNLHRKELPDHVAGGDTVEQSASGWIMLYEETEARKARIAEKAKKLFRAQ